LIADSCFSGDILNPTRGATPAITNEYFRNAYARVSRQVLTSGASESVPDESQFTRQLKLALEGNTAPYLDPLMLYNQIRLGVAQTTPLFGDLKDSGHQQGASFLLFLRESAPPKSPPKEAAVAPPPATRLKIEKVYGSVAIETAISGKLLLDGVPQGTVPAGSKATLENVEAGSHQLTIQYEDGREETRTAAVRGGESTEVSFLAPAPLASQETSGAISVQAGASGYILLDGRQRGRTVPGINCILQNVEAGSHQLTIRYDDGREETRTAVVKGGESTEVSF
jgi:hypothetical protein